MKAAILSLESEWGEYGTAVNTGETHSTNSYCLSQSNESKRVKLPLMVQYRKCAV